MPLACVAWLLAVVVQTPRAAQTEPRAVAVHAGVSFETSENCLACHNGLMTSQGEDVSIGISWRASMMAHSSRDPYWQAAVRREVLDHPTKAAAIEGECAVCHMPMSASLARAAGRHGQVFALLPSGKPGATQGSSSTPGAAEGSSSRPGAAKRTRQPNEDASNERRLAADGVSCTLCHQIGPEGFGARESFNGGFVIAPPPTGAPRMFGPFQVDDGRTAIMRSAAGVPPAEAEHVRKSELCATCHTLYTKAFGPTGDEVGTLPEQMPYLEWRHSAFVAERSCQSCHMPAAESTPIASVLGEPREYLARHTFLGGNFFMLRMLNRHRGELGVSAPSQELDAAARATLRQLETETAAVAVTRAQVVDGRLEADVSVRNATGHKLPTGYPSRRVWLHLTVRDRDGRPIFQSGDVTVTGVIRGNDSDADAARFEPHYEEIRREDEVQIYESVLAGPDGRVTTGLLTATQYVKDNRLLPRGFDKASAGGDIAVRGTAAQDANFTGAGDRLRYVVALAGAPRPFQIDVELRYQPIGFRWAENLRSYDAPEPRRFVSYFDGMAASSSAVLAHAVATTD